MLKEKWTQLKTDSTFRASCIQNMLIIAVILFIVLPIIVASTMSFYRGDDFVENALIANKRRSIIELFLVSVQFVKDSYLAWTGCYFTKFIQNFFHPLNGAGLLQLRVVMIINAVLFVVGVYLFILGIYKKEINSLQCKLLLVACCFVGILGFEPWYQIFYWYTGAVAYTVPLSVLLIALALITLAEKKINYIVSGILLFCASGGSLPIAGIGCYWMLMVCVSRFYKRRLKKEEIILFIIAVIGALINCLAPGNFVRHDVIDESGVHFFRAIIYSFSEVVATGEWLLIETPFIVIGVIALSVGIYIGKKFQVDKNYSLLMIVMNTVAPIVTYYPVCLGYSSGGGPNRCRFILTFVFVVSVINTLVLTGKIIADRVKANYMREAVVVIVLLVLIMPTEREGWKLSEFAPYKTLMELTDGSIQEYYRDVNRIYDVIETDENDDVFIYERPEDIEVFLPMDFNQNPKHLINTEIAQYYGKNSVQWVLEPVYKNGDTYIRIDPNSFEHDLQYVSILNNRNSAGVESVQIVEPFEKNLVLQIPEGETGTVVVYVFADATGENIVEQREFAY